MNVIHTYGMEVTLCLGPSMLPAILALALHNGAIIAHFCVARMRRKCFPTCLMSDVLYMSSLI